MTRLKQIENWIAAAQQGFRRYPLQIGAVISGVLLFSGGGVFALASLAPDEAQIPVRTVVESVLTAPLDGQLTTLQTHQLQLSRSDVSRSTDTADSILRRLGIEDPAAAAFLRNDALARQHLLGRSGRSMRAEAGDGHRLERLAVRWAQDDEPNFTRLVISRAGAGFVSQLQTAPLAASTRLTGGVIQSSLFAAADDARMPDAVALQLAEIFAGDIDFHRALRKGDRFSVVYEALEADGEPIRSGRVLAAEMTNAGRTLQAIWFQDPAAGKGAYYTPNGESLRKAYLASPLEFSRVTSGFKMRLHPILQTWRAHLGVDYAAPTGTPVRSVGDGVVEFAGVQSGFGNVVMVGHRNGHTTVYAHLSRIQVHKGQTISQGHYVGLVGATGWATGPHLHFEFRVNGRHQDPLTLARQSETVPIAGALRKPFEAHAALARKELQAAASVQHVRMQ